LQPIANVQTVDRAPPVLLSADSYSGLSIVYIAFSEPVSSTGSMVQTTLTADSFVYTSTDGLTISMVTQPDGFTNGDATLTMSGALGAGNLGPSGDTIYGGANAIYDLVGNVLVSSSTAALPITSNPALSTSSATLTPIIAGAAGGAAFIILVVIIVSVYCCRRHKHTAASPGSSNVRIELKDLTADEIMAKFDVNKDGVLDQKELNNLMEKIVVKDKGSLEQQTKSASDLHISIK